MSEQLNVADWLRGFDLAGADQAEESLSATDLRAVATDLSEFSDVAVVAGYVSALRIMALDIEDPIEGGSES